MDKIIDHGTIDSLINEFEILHLIYHRNYNQHRLQVWWKYFNILHRKLRLISITLLEAVNSKDREVRSKRKDEGLDLICYLFKKNILKRAYFEFNGIIALGQYITLGLALIGSLSKIYCLLNSLIEVHIPRKLIKTSQVRGTISTIDQDIGEEVKEIEAVRALDKVEGTINTVRCTPNNQKTSFVPQDSVIKTKKKRKASSVETRKKTKKRSSKELDDIFGF